MPSGYHHLTYDQRCQISALRRNGQPIAVIAAQLGRHPSTLYRELARNTGGGGYRQLQAQRWAEARRGQASSRPRKMTPERWAIVEQRLREQWSPEQIAGRLSQQGDLQVSATWIYQYIRADRKAGGELYRNLRQRGKKRYRRAGRTDGRGRGRIPGRVDISERPAIVEQKCRIGDWEADTIVGGRQQGAVLSLVDRASKYTILHCLPDRTAGSVAAAMQRRLGPWRDRVHTITADNGKEFAGHAQVAAGLEASFYFARPYHSWERGLNEHTNGLVRQYFPKKTRWTEVTPEELARVEDRLNHRPRKVLGYRTPAEVFHGDPPDAGEQGGGPSG